MNRAGQLFRPSNGSEGMNFMQDFCDQCLTNMDSCPILINAELYEKEDPEYPKEWIYNKNGLPTCTKFQQG